MLSNMDAIMVWERIGFSDKRMLSNMAVSIVWARMLW